MQDRRLDLTELHRNNANPILSLSMSKVKCGTAILINGINTI